MELDLFGTTFYKQKKQRSSILLTTNSTSFFPWEKEGE